ncbi:MAG: thrombospondin type 3 repeat-containing protein, partial [Deltaproteobacteria bacterium]|nr:thrombospondin type 3 repeat-containing protein [Deltaproteobacteria bacterium]
MRLKNFIQFFFVTVFFLLIFVPSVHSLDVDFFVSPSHSDYGAPIPLYGKTFANNIFFFDHPCAAGSTSNFKDCPSLLHLQDGDVNVDDLLGAPGLPFSRVASGTEVADMLADPVGLCYENFLLNSVCSRDALSNPQLNSPSWSQLVADLRNINAGEPNVVGTTFPDVILDGDVAAPPYDKSMLGSVVANLTDFRRESPPAVCYDITMADDFIACPVYGRIMVRRNRNPLIPIDATEFVELQSPILLYRKMQGGIFKMAGYLSNPSLSLQLATGSGAEQIRMLTQQLPLAIASGKFSNRQGGLNLADIAVLGSSTAPHGLCKWARQTFQAAGRGQLPHGLDCTYGYTWVRKQAAFTTPHETFDAEDLLFGPPKVFDLAVGNDHGKAVLFAPSNAPVANHCFVYKYYEEGMNPVGHPLMPMLGQLIPPRAVEVLPPQAGFCPFKIAVSDINGDGDSDFAITWKNVEDQRIDSEHKFWSSNYAPFFSVYVSSRDAEGKLQYNLLKDFNVPKVASPEADDQAQLAAIAFGTKKNQNFLVVGNQKRILSGDLQRAYDYVFPVSGGIVDDLNVRLVPVDFHPQTDANLPGVADLSVDSSGNIASLIKAPFIPASEGCDISNGQVYGVLWSGDGTPNRCSCRVEGRIVLPDENNDADGDEIAGSCDTCEGKANIGDEDRDAIDGACDNCPSFANPGQEDVDEDVVGDVCDMCPRKFNPDQI